MTPKIKWFLLAEIKSSAVWDCAVCVPPAHNALFLFLAEVPLFCVLVL